MLKNIALAFMTVVLLSGCSCKNKHNHYDKHLVEFKESIGDKVFFDLDSSKINSDAHDTLQRQAEWLKDHKALNVTVEGHCDERGTREYNIALGERRAEMVKKHLIEHGVDADRIDTISYGKERPAVIGNDKESFAKNRRGVTVIK